MPDSSDVRGQEDIPSPVLRWHGNWPMVIVLPVKAGALRVSCLGLCGPEAEKVQGLTSDPASPPHPMTNLSQPCLLPQRRHQKLEMQRAKT